MAQSKKAMGSNPLFKRHETTEKKEKVEALTADEAKEVKQILDEVQGQSDVMTFRIRKEMLKKLRDYAYTERISIKDALDEALEAFFKNYGKELLEAPTKERKSRKEKNSDSTK